MLGVKAFNDRPSRIDLQKAQGSDAIDEPDANHFNPGSKSMEPNPEVRTERSRFLEVSHISEFFRNKADVRFFQKVKGEVTATLQSTSCGAITLQEVCCRGSFLVEGATLNGMTTLLFPGPAEQPASYCGQSVRSDQLMICGQNTGHMAPGTDRSAFQIFIPTGLLEQALADRLDVDAIDFSGRRRLVTPRKNSVRRLRTLVTDWYREFSEDSGPAPLPFAIENLHALLLEELSGILAQDKSIGDAVGKSRLSDGRILEGAREYFERAGRNPVFLNELCRELGVSERTLQLAFQRWCGISPMKYLKLRRLHLLRERLVTSTPKEVSIKRAAIETGLWRLARYTQDYKRLFGELPSETPRA